MARRAFFFVGHYFFFENITDKYMFVIFDHLIIHLYIMVRPKMNICIKIKFDDFNMNYRCFLRHPVHTSSPVLAVLPGDSRITSRLGDQLSK